MSIYKDFRKTGNEPFKRGTYSQQRALEELEALRKENTELKAISDEHENMMKRMSELENEIDEFRSAYLDVVIRCVKAERERDEALANICLCKNSTKCNGKCKN